MGLDVNSKCRLCKMDEETGIHVLCECPALRHHRPVLESPVTILFDDTKIQNIWHKWREKIQQ